MASLDNLIFLLLLLVTIVYWAGLIFTNFKNLGKLGFIGNLLANALLFGLLGFRWLNYGYFPLSNLYESLMFLAWAITLITLIIQDRAKISLIGSISTPISLFVTGFASLSLPESMQAPAPLVPALKSNWLMMHVSMMMISYSTLIIGSLFSILYLAFSFFTKVEKSYSVNSTSSESTLVKNSYFSQFSLLQTVDIWSYRIIGLGFPFLTLGIISGAVWANEAWGSYWSWDPKETWALITWLTFATYLHSRLLKGWQGKNAAILGSVGFFVIWICYLGVNFLGKGLHSYGWIFG